MTNGFQYYPNDGTYWAPSESMYAQFLGEYPNPCRKYHISSDIPSAGIIAGVILPFLVESSVFHKIVKNQSVLTRQMSEKQAGKFITLYMNVSAPIKNPIIDEISKKLDFLKKEYEINPSPMVPKSRTYKHVLMEQPLDDNMFIYGGFVTDPTT